MKLTAFCFAVDFLGGNNEKLTLIVLMLIMMLTLHAEDINNQKIYQPGGGEQDI